MAHSKKYIIEFPNNWTREIFGEGFQSLTDQERNQKINAFATDFSNWLDNQPKDKPIDLSLNENYKSFHIRCLGENVRYIFVKSLIE